MALSQLRADVRRRYGANLLLTLRESLLGTCACGLLAIFATWLFRGVHPADALGAVLSTGTFVGAPYVLSLFAGLTAFVIVVLVPMVRYSMSMVGWLPVVSPRLYKLRASTRSMTVAYIGFWLLGSVSFFIAHSSLVGLEWYDSLWWWIFGYMSWSFLGTLFTGLSVFAWKYIRPAVQLNSLRSFEPWTSGQLNLDVGAFGTESQEAQSRLREYARARRDRGVSSAEMHNYLVKGDISGFSVGFRLRRRMTSIRRRRETRIDTVDWGGLTVMRARLLDMLGVQNGALFLAGSTTDGIRLAIDSLGPLVRGLVLTDLEHPVVVHVAGLIAPSKGWVTETVRFRQLLESTGDEWDVSEALRRLPQHALMWIVSHVDYVSGTVLPLGRLAKAIKAVRPDDYVVVDGAHGPGNIDVRLAGVDIDAYAFCGHKWLMGTPGSGFVWAGPRVSEVFENAEYQGPSEAEDGTQTPQRRASLAMEPFVSCDAHLVLGQRLGWKVMTDQQRMLRNTLAELIDSIDCVDVVKTTHPSSILAFQASGALTNRAKDIVAGCGRELVLATYFPERNSGRICIPYFLQDYDVGNVHRILREVIDETRGLRARKTKVGGWLGQAETWL